MRPANIYIFQQGPHYLASDSQLSSEEGRC